MGKMGRKDKGRLGLNSLKEGTAGSAQDVEEALPADGKKKMPTPKRKAQEAARKRPLVAAAMTKEEKRAARLQEKQARQAEQDRINKALEQVDPRYEKYLPVRDRGVQRRYVRDIVDGQQRSVAQYSMVILVACIFATLFISNQQAQLYFFVVFYAFLLALIIGRFFLAHKIKKKLLARFGAVEPGTRWYGVMRSIQMRRLRLPKPALKPGESPRD